VNVAFIARYGNSPKSSPASPPFDKDGSRDTKVNALSPRLCTGDKRNLVRTMFSDLATGPFEKTKKRLDTSRAAKRTS